MCETQRLVSAWHLARRIVGCAAAFLLLLSLAPQVGRAQDESTVQSVKRLQEASQRGTLQALSTGSTTAFAVTSLSSLEIESLPVDLRLPSGETRSGYVTTIWSPASQLFWWAFQGAGAADPEDRLSHFASRVSFYSSADELLGIEVATPPPSLWCLRSTQRAPSMEKAVFMAVRSLSQQTAAIAAGTAQWMRELSLYGQLPRDFFFDPFDAAGRLDIAVEAIDRRLAGGWEVTLSGRGERTATVVLDDLFNLTATTLLNE